MRNYAGFVALLIVAAAAAWLSNKETPEKPETTRVERPEQGRDAAGDPESGRHTRKAASVPVGTGFDFYILSLSWSPSYCASDAGSGNTQQCGLGKDYGFVVHGLWPQNEGGYPQSCQTDEPERVPDSLGRSLFDIMPGMGLIGHEWRRHGSCSGLSQADYFAVLRAAWDKVTIPPALRRADSQQSLPVGEIATAMTAANPGLPRNGFAITCDSDRLDEIRICLTRDLAFRACGEAGRQGCKRKTVVVPANR